MMIRQRRIGKEKTDTDVLVFEIKSKKELYVKCTCHDSYAYSMRIQTDMKDKDLEHLSNPDFFLWLEETTGMAFIEFIQVHNEYADIPREDRIISWDEF